MTVEVFHVEEQNIKISIKHLLNVVLIRRTFQKTKPTIQKKQLWTLGFNTGACSSIIIL